jgi:hypothetical protein
VQQYDLSQVVYTYQSYDDNVIFSSGEYHFHETTYRGRNDADKSYAIDDCTTVVIAAGYEWGQDKILANDGIPSFQQVTTRTSGSTL